nr:hypothetical protein [uncultured Rhodopila sp.]
MDIRKAITVFGADAVMEYRAKAAIRGETTIPETCLSLHIASSLITHGLHDARVEVPYSNILRELGVRGPDIVPNFGGQRADIAIYDNGLPFAIIEIKTH